MCKSFVYLFIVLCFSNISFSQSFNQDPDNPNLDFSEGDFSNWQVTWGPLSNPGQNEGSGPSTHIIVENYGNNWDGNAGIGNLQRVPDGLERVARLGHPSGNGYGNPASYKLKYEITVNADYPVLYFKIASVLDLNHNNLQNTYYKFAIKNSEGNYLPTMPCTGLTLAPSSFGSAQSYTEPYINYNLSTNFPNTYKYHKWESVAIDLSEYAGQTITLEFEHYDCWRGHHGSYTYLSAAMRKKPQDIYFCQGSPVLELDGYLSDFTGYVWNTGAVSETLQVSDPVDGATYNCTVTSYNTCATNFEFVLREVVTTASFHYTSGTACNQLQFNDLSEINHGEIISWEWDFGDPESGNSNTSNEQHPTHTFSDLGLFVVTLDVTDSFGCTSSVSITVEVRTCGDLSVTKEIMSQQYPEATFLLTAKNNNTDYTDENVIVTDILPSGYEYVSSTASQGTYDPLTGQWSVGTLQPQEEETLELTVRIVDGADYLNVATISGANPDDNPENNRDEAIIEMGTISFTKEALEKNIYKVGEVISYRINIENGTPLFLRDIEIIDPNADAGSIVPNRIASIAPYETASVSATHTVTTEDFHTGRVVNQALLNAKNAINIISKISDDPGTDTVDDPTIVTITRQAHLDAHKDDHIEIYEPGQNTTYVIEVVNNGPSTAIDVVIEDPMPDDVTEMRWTGSNNSSGEGNLHDVIAILQPHEKITYSVTLKIPENHVGALVNVVYFNSSYNDIDAYNNCTRCTDINISKIQKGISPNGDGLNDRLDLTNYEVRKISIYNRNGSLVYEKENYINEWEGQSNTGSLLPTGTYFYYISTYSGLELDGYIYLLRELR